MAEDVGDGIHATNSECGNIHLLQAGEVLETNTLWELLKRLDMDIACSSEKLLNMELCITRMSLGEKDLPEEGDSVSEEQAKTILVLDLSLSYLDSELVELGNFLDSLRIEVVYVHGKLSSCRELGESSMLLQEKHQNAEASLTHVQVKLLEIKKQLGSLHRVLMGFGLTSFYMAPEEISVWFKLDAFCQKKILLQMLDKSIAGEINLEKKLLEIKQSKEELSLKLFNTDLALSSMEMAMELTLQRLLEADNSAELFKEIAREMVSQLQILQFNLNGSLQREKELNSKILEKESALQKRDCNCTRPHLGQPPVVIGGIDNGYTTYFDELNAWKERVKVLEEKLKNSESKLRLENVSNEAGQAHQNISKMEDLIVSMRHSIFIAETRADSAEAKLAELTVSHLELTEELGFLKGSESSGGKISLLEKQVRDLEKQLLHAKASSEASQEQQNMLYSAIWDMETLIEDLNSKVSKAETKLENSEERCLMLAETNSELNKEIGLLKSKGESLETSLKEANRTKMTRAKDINGGAKIITDMVMQLAVERDRLQKQIYSLARENRILMEELRRIRKNGSETTQNNKVETDKETCSSVNNGVAGKGESVEELQAMSSTSNQVNGPLEAEMSNEAEDGSSTSPDNASELRYASTRHEGEVGERERARELNRSLRCFLMAVLFPVIAAGAMIVVYGREMFASYLRNYMGF